MSAPLDPIYCPVCRKEIPPDATTCPVCGAKTTTQARADDALEQQRKEAYLAAAERDHQKVLKAQARADKEQARAGQEEARKKELYDRTTGYGICPNCKSGNVKPYSYSEGGSSTGQSMACCLGCAFNPLAWLLIPMMQGKKKGAFECQYCSNRWSL